MNKEATITKTIYKQQYLTSRTTVMERFQNWREKIGAKLRKWNDVSAIRKSRERR